MRTVRSALLLLVLPLAFAACKPQPADTDDAMMESSAAHSTVVIDLETGTGDAMMAKEESSASSADAMMQKSEAAAPASAAAASQGQTAGSYAAFQEGVLADGQTKVLFFHAAWCPICRAQETELLAWYDTKAQGFLTTYKVDYDAEKDLKATYGVTYQHTFVKVDGQGKLLEKIQGPTDAQLTALLTR